MRLRRSTSEMPHLNPGMTMPMRSVTTPMTMMCFKSYGIPDAHAIKQELVNEANLLLQLTYLLFGCITNDKEASTAYDSLFCDGEIR